jgi:glyoxylase-like metal-dependent hydrolase (beta-lactamase superfamily II)
VRIHHLNCISTCPVGGRLMDGRTRSLVARGELALHCTLVECGDALVLIDTGLGLRDVAYPRRRLSGFFLALVKPDFREEMTAVRQIARLGYDPRDVRHIVLSHLDFDHAGGLDDFPHATVHLLRNERDAAARRRTWLDRQRFRPQQWSTRNRWRVYAADGGEPWCGFSRVRALDGVPPEILVLPLVGHTHGHAGVAIESGDHWLLYAADAYFHRGEMDLGRPHCTPGLRFYQWMMEKDRRCRLYNQHRLRELKRVYGDHVVVYSGHDVVEFERLAGRSARVPAEQLTPSRRAAERPSVVARPAEAGDQRPGTSASWA